MRDTTYRRKSSAEKAATIVALMTPLVEAMARHVTQLGGAKMPKLVLHDGTVDGESDLVSYDSAELYQYMKVLEDLLESGVQPVGWVFESTKGFERVPATPEDQKQIDLLADYDQMLEEQKAAAYSSKT